MAAARANSRVFEEYDPSVEWSFGAEADSVRMLLPGKRSRDFSTTTQLRFKREEIRVLVDNHGHLRTSGQRLIAGARWSRFQKDFQLPSNCNVEGIRAKFENETLTITLPKKTPSPPPVPVAPPQAPRPPVAAAPSQRIPPPIPEARPAPPPPTVPAAKLAPASSQKQPAAESRPSLPPAVEPPAPEVPARLPSVPTPAHVSAKPEQPSLAAVPRPSEVEEEAKRREREMMGKMEEDRKATAAQEERRDEAAAMGEMEMARQPRPASASRGLLVNVAVAVVVLLGITAYVWHSLRNATGGDHGHGRMGAGSYGDEM
ncbi:hypothetical protein HU200_045130 [Digitaria exilis]|uniref:SHSP domain-containing protein n=1 Tax=Digitaria exilis TaxID=1010633 RepID=A0A835AXN7_9POAL|nr:hypothetical protein HU200_045130 [Digitaria exilis]